MRRFPRYVLFALAGITVLAASGTIYFVMTLYTPGPSQQGWMVLTGATVLVGEELERRTGAVVVVRDGLIVAVGDAAELEIPPRATVLDVSGHTLMPGLIDLHVHFGSPELDVGDRMGPARTPRLILDYVRTCVLDGLALLHPGVSPTLLSSPAIRSSGSRMYATWS